MKNDLLEHIRKLNAEEKILHEQRRIQALNRIRMLRARMRDEQRSKTPVVS